MLERRGFSASHSFGAFDSNKLVSFTFNGIGIHLGKSTAYDTGTGTIKEYRGQKLAGKIFEVSIPHLKEEGIEQYLLEVLQHNTPAFNIYKDQGFKISREFNYYFTDYQQLALNQNQISHDYQLQEIAFDQIEKCSSFWDFQPSWQNSLEAINRRHNDFYFVGCFHQTILVGYGILDPKSGDITQIAVDKDKRRQGIATQLFNHLIEKNRYSSVKILNTEKGYQPMEEFIKSFEIPLAGLQYEMIKHL